MTTIPVAPGTAEQLARCWYLGTIDGIGVADAVDSIASFLIGDVGGDRQVWSQLDADCALLWSLMDGLWQESDLDELTDDQWARHDFPSHAHEVQARYGYTRERVAADIERAVWLGRYRAAEARRVAQTAVQVITREQVADLSHGDVVDVARAGSPEIKTRGTVAAIEGRLYVGPYCVRWENGDVPAGVRHLALTVVSRAPQAVAE